MKKIFIFMIALVLIFSGCTNTTQNNEANQEENEASYTEEAVTEEVSEAVELSDDDSVNLTLHDWVLGTEYGIKEAYANSESSTVMITISEENYNKLQDFDFEDIENGIKDILNAYSVEEGYEIIFSDSTSVLEKPSETQTPDETQEDEQSEDSLQPEDYDGETVNLIFIHHSVGENWLNAGLNQMLNENNIHVADTYYGWREMGDRTDTSDWPDWFNDSVMPTVYNELGNMTGYNDIQPAPSENTIIMFKSCYPNSDVGNSIDDEKEIYLSLLSYFSQHPDKMFVLITPPPMQRISSAKKTRELANWLVADDGWRKDYDGENLFVFDFYNVLTDEDNHHMLLDGEEAHIINSSSNTLRYDSSGDDHPSDEGSLKAAEEFVPLLMYWYGEFIGD